MLKFLTVLNLVFLRDAAVFYFIKIDSFVFAIKLNNIIKFTFNSLLKNTKSVSYNRILDPQTYYWN